MWKRAKYISFTLLLFLFVIFNPISTYNKILDFEVNGVVTEIIWNSWDHQMPIIKIKEGNRIKKFKSNRIILTSLDLEVGDSLKKLKGSKECQVNQKVIKCINR
jgi:hypothetical protein